jgi:eukaryotic-like serine/threonine-protein kinase
MGVVLAATQMDLERPVALKFLLPRVLQRPDHVTRFAREARAAAKLESEHVARVLDVGTLENGAPYIVMEYLEGEDLARTIAKRGPLPCEEAVGYLLEACEAVAEAHALGIVHRDLKPSNLFLANRTNGRSIVKVLDFGLSKFSAADDQVTSESSILGSPLYMAPEQLLSARAAEARSDIWSLGVALYELLTARAAFSAERMPELIAAILHGRERPLQSLRADIPDGLQAAVHRCLEKDPSKRFPDVAHFAGALAPFASPLHQTFAARISHQLATAAPAKTEPDTAASAGATADRPAVAESLAGASQSVAMASPAKSAKSEGAQRAPWGARKGRVVGSVAMLAVAAAVGLVVTSRTRSRTGNAPGRTDVSIAPSPTPPPLPDHNVSAPPDVRPAFVEPAAPPPAPSIPTSTRPLPSKTAAPTGSNVPRPPAASAVPPSPSAAPTTPASAAASPSASVDPLAKLKHF